MEWTVSWPVEGCPDHLEELVLRVQLAVNLHTQRTFSYSTSLYIIARRLYLYCVHILFNAPRYYHNDNIQFWKVVFQKINISMYFMQHKDGQIRLRGGGGLFTEISITGTFFNGCNSLEKKNNTLLHDEKKTL